MTTRTQAFDVSVNLMRSILWQYEKAPKAIALSRADQAFIDSAHTGFWTNWVRDVFDLTTANDFGLSVWARILDLPITISRERSVTGIFGFGASHENFGNGGFGRGQDSEVDLDTEMARKLLMMRWFQLTMRPTVPNINRALNYVFGEGIVFVIDTYDMSYATYTFTQAPDYKLRELLQRTNVLPRPSTVGVQWRVRPREAFGFGRGNLNFENGTFGA